MKAQISTEMLAILSAVLVVFLFAVYMVSENIPIIVKVKSSMEAHRVASSIGPAINLVYLAGHGTTVQISVPGENVNATIYDRYLTVISGSSFYTWPLLTNKTNTTNVPLGEIKIKNTDGVVSIEAA